MKIINHYEIRLDEWMWAPELYGVFAKYRNKDTFFFECRRVLYAFVQGQPAPEIVRTHPSLPLPSSWRLVEVSDVPYLVFDDTMGLNLSSEQWLEPLPDALHAAYQKHVMPEKHLVEDAFEFGDYRITHKGQMGYSCARQGEHIWDFQGRAYLYTDINRWQNRVFFGTAGHGGYFYALELDSGKPVAAIRTGGTCCIVQQENRCYFLRYDKKTELLCLDLDNGEITDSVILPGQTNYSRLQLLDGRLHMITFQYRKDRLQQAIWNIVQP
jgi:hypothetical protein